MTGLRRSGCGSWLACDGIDRVFLMHRGVCIAGKPAPTEKQVQVEETAFDLLGFGFGFGFGL
ncbi:MULTISPECIES: hypothetical protein [Pseudomonas]|uniref:Uncharacterized protein n=1 Tax=Pseudomonas poae TaxID=200451 RepID=A0AAP2RYC4_9PSED|nr:MULTISPECIES: hypothetical protein [Pseudomonas]MCF5654118.1 hypothetical protein [Pseudomonas poae]